MHNYQIVAGFSEIKFHLRTQAGLSKSLEELRLWFSFEEDVFYAHDYHDHEKCIALATYNKNDSVWTTIFMGGDFGKQLIQYAIKRYKIDDLVTDFLDLYKSHGYIAFRGR